MVRILDAENLKTVETIINPLSVIFNLNFTESGDFTLTLSNDFVSENIVKNNYILWKENIGIIKYISKTTENITVKGCDIKGLLKQRICKGTYNGTVETVMKNIVLENTTDNRAFPCFSVADDSGNGDEIEYISNGETINSALKNISEKYGVGWEIELEDSGLVFDVVFPQECDIFYSIRHGNISEYSYELDALTEINSLYNFTTAQGLKLKVVDDDIYLEEGKCYLPDGVTYFENPAEKRLTGLSSSSITYCYVKKDKNGNPTATATIYSAKVPSEGIYFLGKVLKDGTVVNEESGTQLVFINDEKTGLERNEAYSSELSPTEELENSDKLSAAVENATAEIIAFEDYKTKWKLGDSVKIRLDIMGQTIIFEKNITALQLVDEANNKRIIPTFGNTKSILKKLLGGI